MQWQFILDWLQVLSAASPALPLSTSGLLEASLGAIRSLEVSSLLALFSGFDLITLNGRDLQRERSIVRWHPLAQLLADDPYRPAQYGSKVVRDGPEYFRAGMQGFERLAFRAERLILPATPDLAEADRDRIVADGDGRQVQMRVSSMMIRSAPKPVTAPPSETALRPPFIVVIYSSSRLPSERKRIPGNRAWYQSEVTMARKSRACLLARPP
jgi:hypothetical protein